MSILPKILFILHLPPPVHGAAVVGKQIHDSKIVNEVVKGHYINLTTAESLGDIGRFEFSKVLSFWKLLRQVLKSVRQFTPDAVYVTPNSSGLAFLKDFIVVQILKREGCRVVLHFHNKGVRNHQKNWFYDALYKRFFRNVTVILLSEHLYTDVARYVEHNRVKICHNGIPTIHTNNEHEKNEVPRLLFLSNLLVSKGVYVVLDACQILRERNWNFTLDVVGDETKDISISDFTQAISQRGLSEVVRYHGKRFGSEKDELLWKADVFVFPTFYHNECFPLVLLEAMQHKLPIISTKEGGIPDILIDGENGLFCEKNDAISLANSIEELLKNGDLRKKMGQRGFDLYQDKFTLQRFEENMTRILLECAHTQ